MKWETVDFEKVFCFCNGKATKYLDSGEYPVYGSNGVLGYSHAYLYTNAIIVGRVGAYCGAIFYCPNSFWASDNTIILQIKDGFKSDIRFCKYMLEQMRLNLYASGSAQPLLTQTILSGLKCIQPPIETQKRIADILSAYDVLIENNQKQIKLLEEAAQRLYKEWFIDLHFPGHETTPIVNGIPEGWTIGNIGEIVEYYDSMRKPLSLLERANLKGEYRYYGAAGIIDHIKKYLFDGTYLLLGEDGSVITPDGFPILQYVTGQFWVNNHAHVLTGKPPFTTEFIYMMFLKMSIMDVVTGVAQPKVSQARLSAKKIYKPPCQLVMRYQSAVEDIFKKILVLEGQIVKAQEARDRLLPKLMSGEMEV